MMAKLKPIKLMSVPVFLNKSSNTLSTSIGSNIKRLPLPYHHNVLVAVDYHADQFVTATYASGVRNLRTVMSKRPI
jgi:hypothetical protein